MKNDANESRTVKVIKRILNVRSWSDWDRMRAFTKFLVDGFKRFFVPQENEARESFVEAKVRLNLSDSELIAKQKGLWRLSVIMISVAALMLIYFAYQLILGNLKASLISIVVMGVALVLAFRYHFWYYQIKEHKLGCSIREWYKYGLKGEKR